MPWKVAPVSELRLTFAHLVSSLNLSVAEACRRCNISRKTGHKWLARFRASPNTPLVNHSTKPLHSPRRTNEDLVCRILKVRQQFGWGPRKIHAFLQADCPDLPSIRTVANILKRQGAILPETTQQPADQRFERPYPNDLWQCDFKGYIEIQGKRVYPFTLLDDHSRFLFAAHPCLDQTMTSAWNALWNAFGQFGLPKELLCDHGFGDHNPRVRTISWFEARLLRLGIKPCHGRPYHPQTQGKLERLHGTLEQEVYPRIRTDSLGNFHADLDHWRTNVYNSIRPHESLGDRPPLTRWLPSSRPRPAVLPEVDYPTNACLRRVSSGGDISWRAYRLLVGAGLIGERIRVHELDTEVQLEYAGYVFRRLALSSLVKGPSL